jgi:hypothetical protein
LRFSRRTLAAGSFLLHKQGGIMDRYFRKETVPERAGASPPSEAWLFAQAVLGNPVPSASAAEADARAKREQFEFLAAIAPERARELRGQLSEEAESTAQREQLEWLAAISPRHESQLRSLLRTEAEVSESQEHLSWPAESSDVQEAQWDPAKHPKGGIPRNRGWWSPTGGSGAEASPFKTASLKAPDTAAIWKGALIAARGQGRPSALLELEREESDYNSGGSHPEIHDWVALGGYAAARRAQCFSTHPHWQGWKIRSYQRHGAVRQRLQ